MTIERFLIGILISVIPGIILYACAGEEKVDDVIVIQEVIYVEDDWFIYNDYDTLMDISFRKGFTGYVLKTNTEDFNMIDKGNAQYIDSVKSVSDSTLRVKQLELNKLRNKVSD